MRLFSLSVFILVILILGCSKDDQYSDEVIMFVASKYADTPNGIYPEKSLNVKIGNENQQWTPLYNNSVENFEYTEGFSYKLLVERTVIKSPPADGSNTKYRLINIIEKIKSLEHEKKN